jgi:hypothetical protein
LGQWERENSHIKAQVIAHYLEKNTRDHYAWEKGKEKAERESPSRTGGGGAGRSAPDIPNWSQFRQGGGRVGPTPK